MAADPPPSHGQPALGDLIQDLERRRARSLAMGGPDRVAQHHATGRLTVRERIAALVDAGSWFEIGLLADAERRREEPVPADAVVTGWAKIGGRKICLIGIDATVMAGTTAPVNMLKQNRMAAFAGRKGLPLIALSDADGGRIPDVMGWRFSGLPFDFGQFGHAPEGRPEVLRITAVLGPSYGDAALHAATAHFVLMTRQASLALSGPSVVASAVGEVLSDQELGGPQAAVETGRVHLVHDGEEDLLGAIRRLLEYLPPNAAMAPPAASPKPPALPAGRLLELVPLQRKRSYDMRRVIRCVVDADSTFEIQPETARNLITALARVEGETVGIVANQPQFKGGVLDDRALAKEHGFIDVCDTFNVPLVFLHDLPGLMIGSQAERGGILRWYERVVSRIAWAHVPKVSVVVRKSYGGGHFAMGGRPTRPDLLVCWPSAELGFMAPETGINTVYRRRLDRAAADGGQTAREAELARLLEEWVDESAPWEAAAHHNVDDVIDPRQTRDVIARGIEFGWGGSRPPSAR